MTKAMPLALIGCLVAGMGYACSRVAFRNTATETNLRQPATALETQYGGVVAKAEDDAGVDPPVPGCGTSGCGTNGPWLGDNIRFQTLHLSPDKENEAHLSILDFRDSEGNPLTIDVQRDQLMGIRQATHQVLTGPDLAGAQLLLGHPGAKSAHGAMTYVLTLEKVSYARFWSEADNARQARVLCRK